MPQLSKALFLVLHVQIIAQDKKSPPHSKDLHRKCYSNDFY